MARSYQVTVGPATKVKLVDATLGGGSTVQVANPTGQPTGVYIGGDENEAPANVSQGSLTITSTTGYYLPAGSTYGPVRLGGQEAIWAITNTNTVTVHVFRAGGVR